MFLIWTIYPQTILQGAKFVSGENQFSLNISKTQKQPRLLLTDKGGIILVILEKCYQMELWGLLTDVKIFSNFNKGNILHQKKLKIFMYDANISLKLLLMDIRLKHTLLLLSTQTWKLYLQLLLSSGSRRKIQLYYVRMKKSMLSFCQRSTNKESRMD